MSKREELERVIPEKLMIHTGAGAIPVRTLIDIIIGIAVEEADANRSAQEGHTVGEGDKTSK